MKEQKPEFKNVKIADLVSSEMNPRKTFSEDSLKELSNSIFEKGVLQPIVVRPVGKKFEIVCGERRYRAAKMAALKEIPAMIRQLDDEAAFDLMITENLQREDVQPMEEAAAFAELLKRNNDYAAIAVRFGKSEVYVRLRVKLNELIPEFKIMLDKEIISISIAQEISKYQDYLQKEIFESQFSDYDKSYWNCPKVEVMRKRIAQSETPALSEAKFDISDARLKKDVGSCLKCTFNTACENSLFPEDINNGRCTNPRCFKQKTQINFDKLLNEAQNNGTLIGIESYRDSSKKIAADLEKKGFSVIDVRGNEYQQIWEPCAPDVDDYDLEDLESAAEYEEEKAEYEKELQEYKKEIAQDGVLKVFRADEDGTIEYYHYRPTGSNSADRNGGSGSFSIEPFKDKLKRNQELEIEGINKDLYALIKAHFEDPEDKTIVITEKINNKNYDNNCIERAMQTFIYMDCDYGVKSAIEKKHLPKNIRSEGPEGSTHKIIEKFDNGDWNKIIKSYLLQKLRITYPNSSTTSYKLLVEIAQFTNPEAAADIIGRHEKKYAKKKASIEAQIAALKKDKKSKKAAEPEPAEA